MSVASTIPTYDDLAGCVAEGRPLRDVFTCAEHLEEVRAALDELGLQHIRVLSADDEVDA